MYILHSDVDMQRSKHISANKLTCAGTYNLPVGVIQNPESHVSKDDGCSCDGRRSSPTMRHASGLPHICAFTRRHE
jgi:hypothetical protein